MSLNWEMAVGEAAASCVFDLGVSHPSLKTNSQRSPAVRGLALALLGLVEHAEGVMEHTQEQQIASF